MSSKDVKPKIRIGQKRSLKSRMAGWTVVALACGGAGFAAYRLTESTEVDVAVAKVRRADFVISVRARGEIKSTRSMTLAPKRLKKSSGRRASSSFVLHASLQNPNPVQNSDNIPPNSSCAASLPECCVPGCASSTLGDSMRQLFIGLPAVT